MVFDLFKLLIYQPGVLAQTCNPSTLVVEAGGSGVLLYSLFDANLG